MQGQGLSNLNVASLMFTGFFNHFPLLIMFISIDGFTADALNCLFAEITIFHFLFIVELVASIEVTTLYVLQGSASMHLFPLELRACPYRIAPRQLTGGRFTTPVSLWKGLDHGQVENSSVNLLFKQPKMLDSNILF